MIELNFADEMEKVALAPRALRALEMASFALPLGGAGAIYAKSQKDKGERVGVEELAGAATGAAVGAIASTALSHGMIARQVGKKMKDLMAGTKTLSGADQFINDAPLETRPGLLSEKIKEIGSKEWAAKETERITNEMLEAAGIVDDPEWRGQMTQGTVSRVQRMLPQYQRRLGTKMEKLEKTVDIESKKMSKNKKRGDKAFAEMTRIENTHPAMRTAKEKKLVLRLPNIIQSFRDDQADAKDAMWAAKNELAPLKTRSNAVTSLSREASRLEKRHKDLLADVGRKRKDVGHKARNQVQVFQETEQVRLKELRDAHEAMIAGAKQEFTDEVKGRLFGVF
jgi:hypothetical protein